MAREAKVLITSSNNIGAGIKSAVKDLTSLESNAVRLGKSIQGAFSAIAITAAAKQVVDFGVESVKAFGEAERAMAQLKTALGGNDQAFSRMNDFIGQMGTKTLASKDEVEALVAELASLGKSETDIKKLTEASVALSNVTGQSLDSAFKALNGTYVGTTKELKKLLPEIGNLTAEQLAAGGAVDMLNEKFGEISDSMGTGISQRLKNLSDGFGDLQENIGEKMLTAFSPMVTFIDSVIGKWNEAFDAHKKYQDALLTDPALAAAMKKVTDLEKLQSQYQNKKDLAAMDSSGIASGALDPAYEKKIRDELIRARRALSAMQATLMVPGADAPTGSPTGSPATCGTPETLLAAVFAPLKDYDWDALFDPMEKRLSVFNGGGIEDNSFASAAGQSGFGGVTPLSSSGGFDLFGGASMNPFSLLMDSLGPVISMLGTMFTSLSSVNQIFNWWQTILASMLKVLGPIIDELLTPIVGILNIIGQVLAASLMPVLKFLTPVIELISEAFVWLYNEGIMPFSNMMIKLSVFIFNGFAAIINGIMRAIDSIPGVSAKWRMDTMSTDGMLLEKINMADLRAAGAATTTNSTSNGGSASYSGSQPITFNFYNQGNVVGQGGLEELAAILQGILARNARYA